MPTKAQLTKENANLVLEAKASQRTINKLLKKVKELKSFGKTPADPVEVQKLNARIKELNELLAIRAERLDVAHRTVKTLRTSNEEYVSGRVRYLQLGWWTKLFMSRRDIRKVLVNG